MGDYALAIIGSAIDWHCSLMQTKSDNNRLHVYSNPLVMTYNDNRLRKPLPAQLISHDEFNITLNEILGEASGKNCRIQKSCCAATNNEH